MARMMKTERAFAEGSSSIRISARTTGPKNARVLTVYVEAYNSYEIEESGFSQANILAHKRGYKMTEGVNVWPITRGVMGDYQTKIEYTQRWRGRSFSGRPLIEVLANE